MKLKKSNTNKTSEQLLIELEKTKLALETAYSNFENSIDPDLIDSYIYEVNAVQQKYRFLIKQIKLLEKENCLFLD